MASCGSLIQSVNQHPTYYPRYCWLRVLKKGIRPADTVAGETSTRWYDVIGIQTGGAPPTVD